ncbi:hypothetical protein H6F77_24390 [Microcoleus sp. FACHB-831]|nr:hypothetical protein [Microcoleus sp. FACHB-831]MBD1924186.1 hypothetical protein [Microcoleus sp. FACHB-831]
MVSASLSLRSLNVRPSWQQTIALCLQVFGATQAVHTLTADRYPVL